MEPTKKKSSIDRRKRDQNPKIDKSSSPHISTNKRSENNTFHSTQDMAFTSGFSYADISNQTRSEAGAPNVSSIYQTSDGPSLSTWIGHVELDLLGLAPQLVEGYQLDESRRPVFADSVGFTQPNRCLHHSPILLMSNSVGGREKSLTPMARWLAEGHTEQCAVLHLQDGQLSIHKECQCNDLLQTEMGNGIE